MKIEEFNMATLVGMVNALGGVATMKTFSQRSKAVERIYRLASASGVDVEAMFDDSGAVRPATDPVEPTSEGPHVDEAPAPSELPAQSELALQGPVTTLTDRLEPPQRGSGEAAPRGHAAPPENTIPVGPASSTTGAEPDAPRPASASTKSDVKKERGPSIRSVAEEKLLEVVGLDENKRRVGLSYEEILTYLHERFPGCKTTVACLRWYAVHMRERNVMPPNRPRAVGKRPAPVEIQQA